MQIVIVGAGPQGRVVLEILASSEEHQVLGFIDDNPALHGQVFLGVPVLGGMADMSRLISKHRLGTVVAVGHNETRLSLADQCRELGATLISAIHPFAYVARSAQVGVGTMICAGAIVCTGARVGDNVLVNTACAIDHDCVVEDGVWLAPGARMAGAVTIERGAYVSSGAILAPGIRVGTGAVVGAGAVVPDHVPPRVFVAGVPARVIRPIDETFNWRRLLAGLA